MGVLPGSRSERVEFFYNRLVPWAQHSAAIGLSPLMMNSFEVIVKAAKVALEEAQQARDKSKAATAAFYNAVAVMDDPGRDYLATIKAYAETTNNPNVLVLAEVPAPAPPTPVPAPATPENLVASVDASGQLTLTWEAPRSGASSGIVFIITKQLGGTAGPSPTGWSIVGLTFDKAFTDEEFVGCGGNVSYRVQARRGDDVSGFAGPLLITMGAPGGEGLTLNTTTAAKLAA